MAKAFSFRDPWRKFIKRGLTTFPEDDSDRPRSDCHPWSASPCFYLLSMTAGIQPLEPGFGSVLIEPHLGGLSFVDAVYPHPKGKILLNLKNGEGVHGTIVLPDGLRGLFRWKDMLVKLNSGLNTIRE